MISVQAITDKYVNVLVNSAAIEAWCQANFGKTFKVYVGIDPKTPPGKSDVPFLVYVPGPSAEGDEVTGFQYTFTVHWVIVDESVATVGKKTTMGGLTKADALGQLILNELRNASANVVLSSWTYYVEPVEFWPMYPGNIEATLNVPAIIGGAVTL